MTVAEAGLPVVLNAGQSFEFPGPQDTGPGMNTKFHRIEADYPIAWEYDSVNAPDRMGHQMMAYSVDMSFADNQPFYTYRDEYHKTGWGTPDCPDNSAVGDALVVINPSTTSQARFAVYNSFDNGTSWNFVGNYVAGLEAAVLIGGTTQASVGD